MVFKIFDFKIFAQFKYNCFLTSTYKYKANLFFDFRIRLPIKTISLNLKLFTDTNIFKRI